MNDRFINETGIPVAELFGGVDLEEIFAKIDSYEDIKGYSIHLRSKDGVLSFGVKGDGYHTGRDFAVWEGTKPLNSETVIMFCNMHRDYVNFCRESRGKKGGEMFKQMK